jgi:hypothetical protein
VVDKALGRATGVVTVSKLPVTTLAKKLLYGSSTAAPLCCMRTLQVIDAIKRATAVALPLPSVLALQWHAIEAACGETARWSAQRWSLERNAARPH